MKEYEDVIKYRLFPHRMEQEYTERVWRGKLSPVSETVVSHLYHDGVVGNNWILFCRQIHQYRIMFAENMRVALAFMFIVLCVERVIILTVGKARMMSFMRVLLALCMAILGSCIFDQIIFRNDIQQAIQEHREDIIKVTITKRLSIYDSDIQRITHEMDSLSKATIVLGEELQKRPTIQGTNVNTQEQVVGVDENGRPKKVKVQSVNTVTMANPLAEQLKANNDQIQIYSNQLEQLRQDKKDIAQKTTEEVSQRAPGFIEELEATLKVVSQSWISLAFYVILFCFLTFLELFVLTIKMGENKCDYELIVEHQLSLKKNLMTKTEQSLTTK